MKKFSWRRGLAGLALLFWLGLALALGLGACSEDALTNPPVKPETLAAFQAEPATNQGSPAAGAKVFTHLPCLTCHSLNQSVATAGSAPNLDHIGANAANRLPNVTAAQYIRHALLSPQDLNIPNYHPIMPSFATSATSQEISDLIAYLLTLK